MATLTAKGISSVAAPLLRRSIVLPATVTMLPGEEFSGSNGDTITVRVPIPREAREQTVRGADITFDETHEIPVDVQVKHLYDAELLTDEQWTLDLESFARQITPVQVDSIAKKAESQLATVMNNLTADDDTVTADNARAAVIAAREYLSKQDCPPGDRFLAVSPEFYSVLLNVDEFIKVNESGTGSALRDATVGRLLGFTVVESNSLTGGTAQAYHRSGFCWANRPPIPATGAQSSASTVAGGVSVRSVLDYISTKLSHASILSTFAGAAAVYDQDLDSSGAPDSSDVAKRFYKLELAESVASSS